MAKLIDIVNELNLTVLTTIKHPDAEVRHAFISDLLSNVMATCPGNCLWLTVQCHMNVIGVASLLDVQAVLLSGNATPDYVVLRKAEDVGVTILQSPANAFDLCAQLANLGLKGILRSQYNQIKLGGGL